MTYTPSTYSILWSPNICWSLLPPSDKRAARSLWLSKDIRCSKATFTLQALILNSDFYPPSQIWSFKLMVHIHICKRHVSNYSVVVLNCHACAKLTKILDVYNNVVICATVKYHNLLKNCSLLKLFQKVQQIWHFLISLFTSISVVLLFYFLTESWDVNTDESKQYAQRERGEKRPHTKWPISNMQKNIFCSHVWEMDKYQIWVTCGQKDQIFATSAVMWM